MCSTLPVKHPQNGSASGTPQPLLRSYLYSERALPVHPEPAVSWHSGFRRGAHARRKTTPVHHVHRRDDRVAARGARAATGDAGGRIFERSITYYDAARLAALRLSLSEGYAEGESIATE